MWLFISDTLDRVLFVNINLYIFKKSLKIV